MGATVKDLKKELDAKGVEYDPKAKKADLEKLLATQVVENDSPEAPEDVAADPHEGPTELGDPDSNTDPIPDVGGPDGVPEGFEEPSKGDKVVVEPISHNGRVFPAGVKVPVDELSDEQVARLERLGAIE